jgi:hypothetical protein
MANEPTKIFKVAADSELGKLVDEARRHPVLLEKDAAQSTVSRPIAAIRMICGQATIPRKYGKQLLPMVAVGQSLMRMQ